MINILINEQKQVIEEVSRPKGLEEATKLEKEENQLNKYTHPCLYTSVAQFIVDGQKKF